MTTPPRAGALVAHLLLLGKNVGAPLVAAYELVILIIIMAAPTTTGRHWTLEPRVGVIVLQHHSQCSSRKRLASELHSEAWCLLATA